MPKSNFLRKKSKTGVTTDFKRIKAKVGKRAPQAASHTDTSFKSKRVRVSAQSILHELGDEDAITARGQGVSELLIQLRHYSPASKREALLGLKSIVDRHPRFAEVNFARLAEGSLELSVCFDNDVRKTLLAYQEALLECVSARTFAPFANLYMAYVVSAMTSLDNAVRRDSLALLALLLGRFPAAVADRAERLAPNYATLLALDPASKKQTGRSDALKSLVSLFRAVSLHYSRAGILEHLKGRKGAVEVSGAGGDVGVRATSSKDSSAAGRLRWKRGSRRNGALILVPSCAAPAMESEGARGGGGGAGGGRREAAADALASILPNMLERLREMWMEALAAVPPEIGLMQSVVDVLLEAIASPAWATIDGGKTTSSGRGPGRDGGQGGIVLLSGTRSGAKGNETNPGSTWFARFVPLVLESFPIRALEGELLGDKEAERLHAIEGLNMGLCELVVAAATGPAAAAAAAATAGGTKGASTEEDESSDWLAPVLAHVHEVLQDGVAKSGKEMKVESILRVLSAAMHSPIGKSKGCENWTAQRQRLLSAFGDFFSSLPPRAEANLTCVNFICTLTTSLLGSNGGGGDQRAATDAAAALEVRRWLKSLPELLCRWEGAFPDTAAVVLHVLVEVAKCAPGPPSACSSGAATGGKPPDGQVRGNKTAGGKRGGAKATTVVSKPVAVAGAVGATSPAMAAGVWAAESSELLRSIQPTLLGEFFSGKGFLSLPAAAQTDAISLLYHLPSVPDCVMSALAAICSDPTAVHGDVRSFVLEVMHHRRRSLTPSAYLSFLVSILTGFGRSRKHMGGSKRTATSGDAGGSFGDGGIGGRGGKRRRKQQSSTDAGSNNVVRGEQEAASAAAARRPPSPPTPLSAPVPTLWETAFARDEVTGAVCNSLAMVGTRGGALIEALRPTLLQLLRGNKSPTERGVDAWDDEHAGKTGDRDAAEEDAMAVSLQRQRAAMASVLCCWEGLNGGESSTTASPFHVGTSESPLTALEKPMATACVQAMRAAGRVEALEQARSVRLLRPVLVLVKRWHSLLPAMLESIVEAAADIAHTVVTVGGGGGEIGRTGWRSIEPLIRCLQAVVRDPGLQGPLRRRHLGPLRMTAETLCGSLQGSPLQTLVVQLRADIELLGGGSLPGGVN